MTQDPCRGSGEQVVGQAAETTADAGFPADVSGSVRTAALRCR
ncbi:hypothetical protein [Rhodococcus oxybenzonivorans]|nr:hypothetical protein [Rhodococcus oxybenzonivorans]